MAIVMFKRVPYPVLAHSYQHLFLAGLTGLLLCSTDAPSAGALVMTGTQAWRLKVLRRSLQAVDVIAPTEEIHRRAYFGLGTLLSLLLAAGLSISVVAQLVVGGTLGLGVAKFVTAAALAAALRMLWKGYAALKTAQPW